jgi:hypothetical protein
VFYKKKRGRKRGKREKGKGRNLKRKDEYGESLMEIF